MQTVDLREHGVFTYNPDLQDIPSFEPGTESFSLCTRYTGGEDVGTMLELHKIPEHEGRIHWVDYTDIHLGNLGVFRFEWSYLRDLHSRVTPSESTGDWFVKMTYRFSHDEDGDLHEFVIPMTRVAPPLPG